MIKTYFFLNRIVNYLNDILAGYTVISAMSQEKEKLIVECRRKNELLYVEISVNPRLPYITVKDKFSRAKKNVLSFFDEVFPSEIKRISIAESDRIIKFELTNSVVYFILRGSMTNVFMTGKNIALSFKKINAERMNAFIEESGSYSYTSELMHFVPEEKYFTSEKELSVKYPFIGKEILAEARLKNSDNLREGLISAVSDIQHNKPAVYYYDYEIKAAVEGLKLFQGWRKEIFDIITDAVNKYIAVKHSSDNFQERKKHLISTTEKELERTASKLNNLKVRLDAGSREEEYNKLGNLLLINIHKITKGISEVSFEDIYDNNKKIKIKIDPSLSPHKNADRYFEKARNDRISLDKSTELYNASVKKYNELKRKLEIIKLAENMDEIKNLSPGSKTEHTEKDDIKSKFKQYIIDGKYNLFVGRDSENNDLLTTRFAKQNDYWFHARSVSGSHAVLRIDNAKEPVPKSVLKKAAAIAAFHSKAKTSSLAPVSYTLKKYVSKKKGMEPGKVSLQKEEVLLVKPEVPLGCEYVSRD